MIIIYLVYAGKLWDTRPPDPENTKTLDAKARDASAGCRFVVLCMWLGVVGEWLPRGTERTLQMPSYRGCKKTYAKYNVTCMCCM